MGEGPEQKQAGLGASARQRGQTPSLGVGRGLPSAVARPAAPTQLQADKDPGLGDRKGLARGATASLHCPLRWPPDVRHRDWRGFGQ